MGVDRFIEMAVKKHGHRFDYSLVEYTGSNNKVRIVCRKHGEFSTTPASHIVSKTGCPHCGRERVVAQGAKRLKSQSHFESMMKSVHGDRYDISGSMYVGSCKKVAVACREHGEFLATPSNLYKGKGCPRCSGRIVTHEEFIAKARAIHGDRYGYDNAVYVRADERVTVTCRDHGDFRILARAHTINGSGCPKCRNESNSLKFRMKTPEFIRKAKLTWGDTFDYSLSECGSNQKDKVIVICRRHGEFKIGTGDHIQGGGCPVCCESSGEREVARTLSSIGVKFEREKRFADCRYKRPLVFDFWLPDKNAIIEFDGSQHFSNTGWGDPCDRGITTRDRIKDGYAKSRNMPLLRIPYWKLKIASKMVEEFVSSLKK